MAPACHQQVEIKAAGSLAFIADCRIIGAPRSFPNEFSINGQIHLP